VKKALLILVVLAATAGAALAANEKHVKAPLEPVGGSGISGFVQLMQIPGDGTRIHVHAVGLEPGVTYASFYYDGANCESGPDLVGTFTANAAGVGTVHGIADDELDEIASVSVRTPDYSVLFACANVG
jgi:hypothetical protein